MKPLFSIELINLLLVAPYAGAWIETGHRSHPYAVHPVAPYAGAWIETSKIDILILLSVSLPTRERGLKRYPKTTMIHTPSAVAPYAGAWIETNNLEIFELYRIVAPYAGAWIETGIAEKYLTYHHVAPYAGAWIETK